MIMFCPSCTQKQHTCEGCGEKIGAGEQAQNPSPLRPLRETGGHRDSTLDCVGAVLQGFLYDNKTGKRIVTTSQADTPGTQARREKYGCYYGGGASVLPATDSLDEHLRNVEKYNR